MGLMFSKWQAKAEKRAVLVRQVVFEITFDCPRRRSRSQRRDKSLGPFREIEPEIALNEKPKSLSNSPRI